MTDFYLKFSDKAQADSVLYTTTPAVLDEEGAVVAEEQVTPNYANIDVLGTIYSTAAEGEEPVALDGYHVNVRVVGSEDAQALAPFSVLPTLPRRIWG
jgi:hypothetical protein